ncbi:hypothetical protein [Caproicibacter fermentans]|uniref:hypothetical protein n=1 Tax=Caproicibacter fermentans TaxID=2576756 RepID=UPI0038B3C2E8
MQELYTKVTAMQTQYYTSRGKIAATARQIDELNKRISMWNQYSKNKVFHQSLTNLKPRAREKFQDAYSVELALYDAAVRYLDSLKASGEKITPKHWQTQAEQLAAQNSTLYQQMKSHAHEYSGCGENPQDRRRACPIGEVPRSGTGIRPIA